MCVGSEFSLRVIHYTVCCSLSLPFSRPSSFFFSSCCINASTKIFYTKDERKSKNRRRKKNQTRNDEQNGRTVYKPSSRIWVGVWGGAETRECRSL